MILIARNVNSECDGEPSELNLTYSFHIANSPSCEGNPFVGAFIPHAPDTQSLPEISKLSNYLILVILVQFILLLVVIVYFKRRLNRATSPSETADDTNILESPEPVYVNDPANIEPEQSNRQNREPIQTNETYEEIPSDVQYENLRIRIPIYSQSERLNCNDHEQTCNQYSTQLRCSTSIILLKQTLTQQSISGVGKSQSADPAHPCLLKLRL
uniref:uncharacterized protein LOC120345160 isoform X2 n=1 Tax=Styela clava TaxID=7725 RepID=UPI00193A302A|nr:uncharacterized protein LOC120345160 isoform X2 [Styela clava]